MFPCDAFTYKTESSRRSAYLARSHTIYQASYTPPSSSSPRKISLETLAQNCFIPHDLRPLYAPLENCALCDKRPMGAYFLKGECCCEAGTTKQEIIICARCLEEYDSLSNYVPKLVVSDKLDSVEDIITKSCEYAASKSSPWQSGLLRCRKGSVSQ